METREIAYFIVFDAQSFEIRSETDGRRDFLLPVPVRLLLLRDAQVGDEGLC